MTERRRNLEGMGSLEADVVDIRGYELRLIRCTLTPSPSPPAAAVLNPAVPQTESSDGLVKELLDSIECGNYAEALTSHPCRLIFQLDRDSLPLDCAERLYSELVQRSEYFVTDASASPAEQARRVMLVTCIAVAAFLGFTQCNFTG